MAQLSDVLLQGLRSAQPAATAVADGTLYYVTDEFKTEQSNGVVWSAYSGTSGSLAINQLTGDVTAGPGSGSQAATIASHAVTNAKFRQGAALSIVGVTGNATADVADIAAGVDGQVLRRSGTSLAFGALSLATAAAVTGTLPVGNGGTGLASYTIGDLLYASATTTLAKLASPAAGLSIMSNGVGVAPTWDALAVRFVRIVLTNAQILALPTTPITLVAAPGANKRIKVLASTLRSDTAAGAYTHINATYCDIHLELNGNYQQYGPVDDSTTTPPLIGVSSMLGAAGAVVIDAAVPTMASVPVAGSSGYVQPTEYPAPTVIVDKPLQIKIENNGSGDLLNGHALNTLTVYVYYTIQDLS